MKLKVMLFLSFIILTSCADLDLSPLSEGSSGNWYSSETEWEMSVNNLYKDYFWPRAEDDWTDDWTKRNELSAIASGTVNSQWSYSGDWWTLFYKCIARCNTLLANLDKAPSQISGQKLLRFEAEARLIRAIQYSRLIFHWGDVVFTTKPLGLEEAFTLSRTDKSVILKTLYEDFDFAIENLPVRYGDKELKRATQGAALAFKARTALYNGDWALARDAAQACMALNQYELYPDFSTLFLSRTKNTKEGIFVIPRSVQMGVFLGDDYTWFSCTRNAGGLSWLNPSWELFCSYLCTDGLPINESPLFDPKEPFTCRDPRCSATIVEFQTPHLGFIYQPHPDSVNVLNVSSGQYQKNNDTRTNAQYASFNGLVWKKGIDEDWSDDRRTDPDKMVMRYADVLLMYAEAKIELNEIDQTVLDAMNQVRARAYKADVSDVNAYPAITSSDRNTLRKVLRNERRMEFAWEGLRYYDIIRWRIAEKVLNKDVYGMLDPDELREKVIKPGLWFFPSVPELDEDGSADFIPMYNSGLVKILADRKFDASRQYLWPIPSKEILINNNLKQNPGY